MKKVVNQKKLKDINGVKGPSVVMKLPVFHIIYSFPPEFLHSVAEGVTKLVVDLKFYSKNHAEHWYLGRKVDDLDNRLLNMKPPSELTRCPRSIKERALWKALSYLILFFSDKN